MNLETQRAAQKEFQEYLWTLQLRLRYFAFAVALVVGPRSHPIEVRSGCTYLKILGLSVGIVGGMVLDYRFGLTPQLNQTRATPSVSLPTSRVFQSALRARELPEHRSEILQLNE